MPSNPWHPKLPTSAKARRMLKAYDDAIEMAYYTDIVVWDSNDLRAKEFDSRFIIGTVAARLCELLGGRWLPVARQWRKWAEGEDWL